MRNSGPSGPGGIPAEKVTRGAGRLARSWRLAATAVVLALVLAGTLWGSDSDFPLGPFRMYSTRDDPNAPVVTTQVEGTTATGERLTISGPESGLRRAEVEGELGRFVQQPALLASLAAAYHRYHPDGALMRLEVVRREYPLRGGRATGGQRATVLASWSAP